MPADGAENVRRGLLPKLSLHDAREIRCKHASLISALADQYAVSAGTIRLVIARETWREDADADAE